MKNSMHIIDFPWMSEMVQWRNEAILNGLWASLMMGNAEVRARIHAPIDMRDNVMRLTQPLKWEKITTSADSLGLWIEPEGGKCIRMAIESPMMSLGDDLILFPIWVEFPTC